VKIVIFNFYLIINFFNYSEIIYTQLLKLIALEKAKKLGEGRRVKKTLRKRRKHPYAKKKSKRR
jgi:hypothetical protein